MDAAEEEQDSLVAQLGKAVQKQLALLLRIAGRRRSAVADHHFIRLVKPETLSCQQPLLLGGEEHRLGISKDPEVSPGPVGPLLNVLERVSMLEPGIQHPVGIDEVGNATAAQGAPGGEGVVLPDAVDDYGIVLLGQREDAGGKAAAVAVSASNRA